MTVTGFSSSVTRPAAATAGPLVELDRLVVEYALPDGRVRAVDGVSLAIHPGEIVGLAGESACGKSTTAHALMRILRPPGEIASGRILFRGEDVCAMSPSQLRRFRWRNVSIVFQSAMNALNPVMRVGDQFVDMYQAHERIRKGEALSRAGELLELVGIDRGRVRAYPHELSGGMRQRVARFCRRSRSSSESSGSPCSSSRTTSRCWSSSAIASRSCTEAGSSSSPRRNASSRSHSIRTQSAS
jgi:ABC-type lipoprotein export system ATPase subunit